MLCDLRNNMHDFPEKDRNIDSMSESVNVSRSYLQRMYKSYFGKSIFEELIYYRMEKAKKLLAQTKSSVSEIAESVAVALLLNQSVRNIDKQRRRRRSRPHVQLRQNIGRLIAQFVAFGVFAAGIPGMMIKASAASVWDGSTGNSSNDITIANNVIHIKSAKGFAYFAEQVRADNNKDEDKCGNYENYTVYLDVDILLYHLK